MQAASRVPPLAFRTLSRRTVAVSRRRFATEAASSSKVDVSHAVAGLAGGAVVLGGVYIWYRASGTQKVVQTTKSISDAASKATTKLQESAPSPKETLDLLRSFSKSYLAAIPAAGPIIDSIFERIDDLAEKHGKQVEEVVKKTYADLSEAIKDKKNGADKVLKALQEATQKLKGLAEQEGGKALDKLYESNPDLKKVVGTSSDELSKLADKYGPEAQKIAEDAYNRAIEIVRKGGLNAKTYEEAKKLLEDKTKEVQELAKKSGSEAWAASAKAASPLLDKLPDVKKTLDDKIAQLKGLVGEENVKVVQDLYAELEKVQKSDKSAEEKAKAAKKIVEERIGSLDQLRTNLKEGASKAQEAASSSWAQYASAVPGLGGLAKVLDGEDLKKLKDIAEKHGDEAEKILKSAYSDIQDVLKKHVNEAKKVAEGAKEDAKKQASK